MVKKVSVVFEAGCIMRNVHSLVSREPEKEILQGGIKTILIAENENGMAKAAAK
jgi:hypothetical protein